VTVQAQILDLLARERARRQMALILITHDLGIVAGRADEVAVMYAGRIVERAPTRTLFKEMRSPYAEALMAAIPKLHAPPHTRLAAIGGTPPDPTRPAPGCAFHPRCAYAQEQCRREVPPLSPSGAGDHHCACWFPLAARAKVEA
jgi:peptide/nickel transport system ATP-binding protein